MSDLYYLKKVGSGKGAGITPLKKEKLLIGRAAQSDLCILDIRVSRSHAVLRSENGKWFIKNCGASGLFIDRNPIDKDSEIQLNVNNIIQFGCSDENLFCFLNKKVNEKAQTPSSSCTQVNESLLNQHTEVQSRLRESELEREKLLLEKEHLQNDIPQKMAVLQESFKQSEQELEKKHREGLLVQQNLLEEKETRASELKNQIKEMEEQSNLEKTQLEEKLKNQADIKENLLEERDLLAASIQVEKEILEKQFSEQLKQVKCQREIEKKQLDNQVLELEQQQAQLQQRVQQHEQSLKQKEEAHLEIQKKQQVDADLLQKSLQELEKHKHEVQLSKQEKQQLATQLENLTKHKQDANLKLQTLQMEKIVLEAKLIHTSSTTVQINSLQKALKDLQSEKCSLENQIALAPEDIKNEVVENVKDVFENELQCAICNELFIRATMLNCGHLFCEFCINCWKKNKNDCPQCRETIRSQTRPHALDGFIERMVETLSADMKQRRLEFVEEREEQVAQAEALQRTQEADRNRGRQRGRGRGRRRGGRAMRASRQPQRRAPPSPPRQPSPPRLPMAPMFDPSYPPPADRPDPYPAWQPDMAGPSHTPNDHETIYINSSPYSDRYSRSRSPSEGSEDSYMSGDGSGYYGGYGRCHICGMRGHWAGGCPN